MTDYHIGDRVEYFLSRCPSAGRDTDWWLPATVVNVTAKRLVLRIDRWPTSTRITVRTNVRPMATTHDRDWSAFYGQ